MAFTATIQSITYQADAMVVAVVFADSASGWSTSKSYPKSASMSNADLKSQITNDGTNYKADIAKVAALQAQVGAVITI